MNDAEFYRGEAAKAAREAELASDPHVGARLKRLEKAWLLLAMRASERENKLPAS
jgi:hypothetical protein